MFFIIKAISKICMQLLFVHKFGLLTKHYHTNNSTAIVNLYK